MVIRKHIECDLCGEKVGVNRRYYIIKSKCLYIGCGGSFKDNRKHHICEDCIAVIREHILLINEFEEEAVENDKQGSDKSGQQI